jgi:hypothetical protein
MQLKSQNKIRIPQAVGFQLVKFGCYGSGGGLLFLHLEHSIIVIVGVGVGTF